MNLYTLLAEKHSKNPDGIFIEIPGGKSFTWAEAEKCIARFSNLFASLGLPSGSRIAVIAEKSPEALFAYLATLRAGYVFLPLNTAYQHSEVEYFLGDSEASVVICSPENEPWITPIKDKLGIPHLFTIDQRHSGSLIATSSSCSDTFETVKVSSDDLAAILYTSGTTGKSKGAMLSHHNLFSNVEVLHSYWGWSDKDILLHVLPIFHAHGLFVAAQGALFAGAKMIWLAKFDPKTVAQLLPQCTVMMGIPTHYVRILTEKEFTADTCRDMRLFISGSAPLLAETFESFHRHTNHAILERYGMTETVMLSSNPYDPTLGERLAGTVGKPLPGVEVRVVNEKGALCQPGEIGIIHVKGPNIFKGYWRMPEKTREEFTPDGWFITGDMGKWGGDPGVPDTYLSIVGRAKDLIISGGYNVYPKEIEGFVDDIPGVLECAVIGVPHPDFGEAVVAIVVADGSRDLDPQAMITELKSKIANFKVPKKIFLVPELPRNTMGKVQKKPLREQHIHLFTSEAGVSK